jgi:hypothetical protein
MVSASSFEINEKRRVDSRLFFFFFFGRSVGDACFEYGSLRKSHQLKMEKYLHRAGSLEPDIVTAKFDNSPNL